MLREVKTGSSTTVKRFATTQPGATTTVRYGFHWFPDEQHLQLDLFDRFLPHLVALRAGWLVIRAPLKTVSDATAIASRLHEAGVQVLLHLLPSAETEPEQLHQAVRPWVKGGVRVIALDEKPNSAARWNRWEPQALPRRYIRWLAPLIDVLAEFDGVTPLLPPLQPGGDYWDTAFLAEALAELKKLSPAWLDHLGVACVNDLAGRPVTWGHGGPARWGLPGRSRKLGQEDQIGFRAWEWYRQIAESELERPVAVYALSTQLAAGRSGQARASEVNLIRKALAAEPEPPPLGAAFWLLAEEPRGAERKHAWFLADGMPLQEASLTALRRPVERSPLTPGRLPTSVRVLMAGGRVQRLPIEEYLRGVLPAVLPAGAPMEALKAQAIAARSLAVRAAQGGRHDSNGADLCTTSHCQIWYPRYHRRTDEAIRETSGQVLVHDGKVINAFYFPSCDGRTRSSEEVWRTTLPYCRSVSCPAEGEPQQGHGVGLCQRGMVRMAQQGAGCIDILRYYYEDIRIYSSYGERAVRPRRSTQSNLRIERRDGSRAIAGTMRRAGQPVTVLDPWGNRYETTSGSNLTIGPNGWAIQLPVDAIYRVHLPGRKVEIDVRNDCVVLHAA